MNNGTLYVVATPIGNLQDLSPRAKTILSEVDLIAAEDTRHSRQLLKYFNISTPLQSLHEHNEKQQAKILLKRLFDGDNIALISDAGTPLISDPGQHFLQLVLAEQITVIPIPGACALISALSIAGFSADKFVFEGFLSAKSTTRQQRLEELKTETRTLVFYEAPHRIVACIEDILQVFGEQREIALVKELTKIFETVYRNNLPEVLNWLQEKSERSKGEFVLVIQGYSPPDNKTITPEAERIFKLLRKDLALKQAAKLTSEITGISKNSLYTLGLKLDSKL
ncbi:16S rRNA (cytidine(1402)-2'-O)-methyltransferase [Candidatus Halobeggiatoa sp. HSG11]|nr:16S rRNA (cytidine(1402)-2'-O)-methyltransferase [Candidatus Halobeggiatoa sp. HSG11]